MIGKKLVKILQTLDAQAFRRLGDAVTSPCFTNSPLQKKLYEILKKEYPDFKSEKLDKEKIFKKLYPGKPFNDGALRVLVSEFTRLTEDFVLFESLKNDETARQKALTQWYGEHNLYAEFEKGVHALLTNMEQQPYRDVEFFSAAASLNNAYFFHQFTEKYSLDDQVLTQLMDNIDQGYILLKLRLATEMKNREQILSKHYNLRMVQEAVDTGAAGLLADNTPFLFYSKLLVLYHDDDNTDMYFTLKRMLTAQIGQLRPFDQSMLLNQLVNYGVRQLNKGDAAFNQEIFDLYQLGIAYNLERSNGKIDTRVFRNIVTVGCKVNQFDWTEKFIHTYEPFLEPETKQETVTMSLALLFFHRADYDKTISLISGNHFPDLLLQMSTRVILTKAWFEKFMIDNSLYDLLMYQIDTNEKFVRRNVVISALKKEENLNFLLATRRLADLRILQKPARDTKEKLERYLAAEQRILSRDWLQLKMQQCLEVV